MYIAIVYLNGVNSTIAYYKSSQAPGLASGFCNPPPGRGAHVCLLYQFEIDCILHLHTPLFLCHVHQFGNIIVQLNCH